MNQFAAACCAALVMTIALPVQAWQGEPLRDRLRDFLENALNPGECPVGLVNDKTLNDEFGPGTDGLTRCLSQRTHVKVVMQVNRFCRDSVPNADCASNRAYALGNLRNMIKDYEITHGMVAGRDFKIVAVVHSGGGWLMLKDEGFDGDGNPVSGRNQFQSQVEDLIDMGVDFYFCQNTTRGFVAKNILPDTTDTAGGATAELIDGVNYTTAGVTAIADFQSLGYRYVQP
jgi:intracellular sulfur oxidation DsrE/DsrF family protein